jgi:hypothetical protein
MHHRRRFLTMIVGAACSCCTSSLALAADAGEGGCMVGPEVDRILKRLQSQTTFATPRAQASASDLASLVKSTGDPAADLALRRALAKIAETFKVTAAFGFLPDDPANRSAQMNAWASSRVVEPGTDGTVFFGRPYYDKHMGNDPSGITVLAILAHEYGHIRMFKSGLRDRILAGQSTTKRTELHADFMSGFYLGLLKRDNPEAPFWRAINARYASGSYNYTHPRFHGTPEERLAAVEGGYHASFTDTKTVDEAWDLGLAHIATK